jgi:hypothetical protein
VDIAVPPPEALVGAVAALVTMTGHRGIMAGC